MNDLSERLKVLLSAAPTYLIIISGVLTALAEELPDAPRWIVTVAAWLATAVLIIRRVTPVPPAERGLLPKTPAAAFPPYEGEGPLV